MNLWWTIQGALACVGFWVGFTTLAGSRRAADVHASCGGGWFTNSVRVELQTQTPGATVLFTTDGSEPQRSTSQVYREPITLNHTTILRATATHPELASAEISTWSFLRATDWISQSGEGWPGHWGQRAGKPVPADYAMDPAVTRTSNFGAQLADAIAALPVVSVVVDPSHLFHPTHGIYANPMETGDAWERRASVEFLPTRTAPADDTGFKVDCGVRIQGGWNRRPEESPKHSLRLIFRKRYGMSRLKYSLFPGRPTEFTSLILRGGNNNSWLHWSGEERRCADYLRDEWMRRTYAALGQVSARGRLVHVCLNGAYWGIYDLCERPDEDFAAAHLGGRPDDYDARNADKILSGDDVAWRELMQRIDAGIPDEAALRQIGRQLDLPAFIDYALINLYGANGDMDGSSNWYAARHRKGDGRFRFFVWDGERTLEQVEDSRLSEDAGNSPWRIFQRLRKNPGFCEQFGARAREVCGGHGVLAPGPAAARFRELSETLAPAIILESARWGDHRLVVNPYKTGPYERYTVAQHWQPEIQRLLQDYFPSRAQVFLEQLRAGGLYN